MNNYFHQSRRVHSGFTLAEIMCSLMIFTMVATAGTYMAGAMNNNQKFFRDGTNSQSEVEFALGRIVENVRAATTVSSPTSITPVHTLTLNNISGIVVTYQINASGNLIETVGSAVSTLVHNASFSVQENNSNPKAFDIKISSGTDQVITRSVTAFGRNL
jgi:prepilin-type N-terminal cleavage/methylation domain-containing protein